VGVTFPKKSVALTVKLNDVPAVCGDAADTTNCEVGPGVAVNVLLVPVMLGVTESVAVTDHIPDVFGETLKFKVPFIKVRGLPLEYTSNGSSLLVRFTIPL